MNTGAEIDDFVSQMEKFNNQLEQLDNLMIHYMKYANTTFKFNTLMSPTTYESNFGGIYQSHSCKCLHNKLKLFILN